MADAHPAVTTTAAHAIDPERSVAVSIDFTTSGPSGKASTRCPTQGFRIGRCIGRIRV
jgi:hypothetical protein